MLDLMSVLMKIEMLEWMMRMMMDMKDFLWYEFDDVELKSRLIGDFASFLIRRLLVVV